MENKNNTLAQESANTQKDLIKREYVDIHKDSIKKTYSGVNKENKKPFKSILIKVSNDFEFWLDTKFAFADEYTNYVTLSLVPAALYQNVTKNDTAIKSIEGATIIKHLKSIK